MSSANDSASPLPPLLVLLSSTEPDVPGPLEDEGSPYGTV